jgi:hypothetical protein
MKLLIFLFLFCSISLYSQTPKPLDINVTNHSITSIKVSWEQDSIAQYYIVYYGKLQEPLSQINLNGNTSSVIINNIDYTKPYRVIVIKYYYSLLLGNILSQKDTKMWNLSRIRYLESIIIHNKSNL